VLILATGTITRPAEIGPHIPDEVQVLNELKATGPVRSAFRSGAQPGFIAILDAASIDDAKADMQRLPFVAVGLMSLDYQEITEI
jgi:hypothetical protein